MRESALCGDGKDNSRALSGIALHFDATPNLPDPLMEFLQPKPLTRTCGTLRSIRVEASSIIFDDCADLPLMDVNRDFYL